MSTRLVLNLPILTRKVPHSSARWPMILTIATRAFYCACPKCAWPTVRPAVFVIKYKKTKACLKTNIPLSTGPLRRAFFILIQYFYPFDINRLIDNYHPLHNSSPHYLLVPQNILNPQEEAFFCFVPNTN